LLPHAAVHGFVGEAIGFLVFVAEDVLDREGVELGDAALGFVVERAEVGTFDLVLALDLFDHQLGVGDDTEAGVVVFEREIEGGEEAGVFGEVVGADAEVFVEFGDFFSVFVLDVDAESGVAGVAARASVAEGGDDAGCGWFGGRLGRPQIAAYRGIALLGHVASVVEPSVQKIWRC